MASISSEEDEDLLAPSKKKFTEELEKLFSIRRGDTYYLGKHVKIYKGVKIKNWDLAKQLVPDLETPEFRWFSQ